MKPGAAETAPLLQKLDETNQPKPGAIAAAVRQAKRGVGVFGVALALSGVLVAVLNAPDATKKQFELQMDATTPATTSADEALCVPNKWAPGSFTDPTKDQKNRITLTDACKAQFTCPAGNYCPAGTIQATSVADANAQFSKTYYPSVPEGTIPNTNYGDVPQCEAFEAQKRPGWYFYQCQCLLGFWCPQDIVYPRFCPEKFECTRPERRHKCPEGRYCLQGTVKGLPCGGKDCPKGTNVPSGGAFFLFYAALLTLFAYGCFYFRGKYTEEKMSRQNQELEDYYQVMQENDETEKKKRADSKSRRASTSSLPTDEGYRIEFNDLRLKLPTGEVIMRGPSGALEPGKTTAIMGASGAGKTTIMNLITGKVKKTGGWITCNGEACDDLSRYRSRTAFVPQEDVMHRELTVLENVTFSADIRLPVDWTPEMRREKIMQTLYTLDLTHIQHSIIGDEFERGISGGQRKRVNVALELVADPKLLFLDEPTSGLDSVSATKLCKILRETAENQRLTIAAVIHSPGPEAFAAFHNFLLLQTGGRQVYYGPTPEVEGYFADIGFRYPRGETLAPLADFILCAVAGDPPQPSANAKYKVKGEFDHMTGFTKLWHIKKGLPPPEDDEPVVVEPTYMQRFMRVFKNMCYGLAMMPLHLLRVCCPPKSEDHRPVQGFFSQFVLCFRRACHQNYSNFTSFFLGVILLYVIIGFALGALMTSGELPPNVLGGFSIDICNQQFPEMKDTCLDFQSNGFLASISPVVFIFVALAAATSASTFGCETAQYWRECSTGLNTAAYFFAKAVADIPIAFASTFALWAPFVASYNTPMDTGELFFALLLLVLFGYESGYFLSFLLPYRYCGLAAVAWSVFWGIIFSGFGGIQIHDSPQLKFIFYSSGPRWFLEGFFYATTVYPYKRVRAGPTKGKPYYEQGVQRMRESIGYWNTFWESMGYLFLVTLVLTVINLMLISGTRLDKKV